MTSGIVADLDLAGQPGADPFAELLDKLATAVIVGASVSCEYEIPEPPQGEEFNRERVNVVYTNDAGTQETYPMVPEHLECESRLGWKYDNPRQPTNRDNSPLSERIAKVVVITVLSVTERILPAFVREAKSL